MPISESGWKSCLAEGLVIPALPLTLDKDGVWSQRHQRAVVRYYIDAGAGGIAAGVHSTQFEIRDPRHGLFEPVLQLVADVIQEHATDRFVRIAGICGAADQACAEAAVALDAGYHAGLLSLTAFRDASELAALDHVRKIAAILPVVGFYLQPAVGGRIFSYSFWREFCEIDKVIAVKIAPFNRYYTWDVVRAVMDSGRDEISLYTGNDDNIIVDLLTRFEWRGNVRRIVGGLLGQWGVWTKRAVEMLDEIRTTGSSDSIPADWLTRNVALTDANAAVFDAANGFTGCIPGILEVLRRQGLTPSCRCLNLEERLSPGQEAELNRVGSAWPWLTDDEFVRDNLSSWLS